MLEFKSDRRHFFIGSGFFLLKIKKKDIMKEDIKLKTIIYG